ncbi:hypothetical protein ABPG75_002390 [Micractinium tetrahymenae]
MLQAAATRSHPPYTHPASQGQRAHPAAPALRCTNPHQSRAAPAAPWAGKRHWQAAARRLAPATAAAATGAGSPEGAPLTGEEARERAYVRALLLAFFASQNRSLFAAKCFVEVVIEIYQQGATVDDVKVALSLAGLQHGGQLLSPMDEDILLSWVAVVMMALQMVGVPLAPEGVARQQLREQEGGRAEDSSSMGRGLQGMVKIAVDKFLGGTDLYRLQLEQSMAGRMEGDPDAMGESPAVRMLQQNTRLVIIALEVVRDMGLATEVPLHQPPPPAGTAATDGVSQGDGELQPAEGEGERRAGEGSEQQGAAPAAAGQAAGAEQRPPGSVAPGFVVACDPERLALSGSVAARQRAAGVRLLLSFMGAAMGWLYPAWDFVEQCCECYSNGWAADEVYGRLNDEEFAQSGGMAYLRVARLPGNSNVTATVMARWISLIYMTLAQLRVVFPGATQQDGWAWVSGAAGWHDGSEGTSLEAYGLADFVVHTIRNEERKEQEQGGGAGSSGSDSSGEEAQEEAAGDREAPLRVEGVLLRAAAEPLERRPQQGFVRLEDPGLVASSPTTLMMSQQISLVQMTRQLVLQERARAVPLPAV